MVQTFQGWSVTDAIINTERAFEATKADFFLVRPVDGDTIFIEFPVPVPPKNESRTVRKKN